MDLLHHRHFLSQAYICKQIYYNFLLKTFIYQHFGGKIFNSCIYESDKYKGEVSRYRIGIVRVGVKLCPLATAATNGLLCLPRVIMMTEKSAEWWLAGETEVLGENLPKCRLVYHKSRMIGHTRTRVAAGQIQKSDKYLYTKFQGCINCSCSEKCSLI
jgi:hypothetical protein